ncbi:DNA-methyltransferase [Mycobacteroides abscessus]|uniref:DNA-methyltransferase n=1 Tax=Mycobacteroides abscessus TaxID=36809 RepID=UPI00078B447B|nr:DNA methyltransferase [Mycobacteroides abscessus]AMU20844.1 hypothetical protein A3N95_08520 [Mycobacteroides abscessus]
MKPYYQDDLVTLFHGDCLEITEWLGADVLVTDPPYGLGDRMTGAGKWGKLWGSAPPSWDAQAPIGIPEMASGFEQAIVWGGNYFQLPPRRGWLVWDKVVRNFTSGHCELAWTSLDQPVRAFSLATGHLANEGKMHPTQKPLPLMQWCLAFTQGVVADPFSGSGSTLVAARNLGRRAIGVELEEKYCEIAARRLDQMILDFQEGA